MTRRLAGFRTTDEFASNSQSWRQIVAGELVPTLSVPKYPELELPEQPAGMVCVTDVVETLVTVVVRVEVVVEVPVDVTVSVEVRVEVPLTVVVTEGAGDEGCKMTSPRAPARTNATSDRTTVVLATACLRRRNVMAPMTRWLGPI